MGLKTLIIDDDSKNLNATIKQLINAGHICKIMGFEKMEEVLIDHHYDVIILDYKQGMLSLGKEWFDFIWSTNFCPIIFHSAFAEEIEVTLKEFGFDNHPLIKIVVKGPSSYKYLLENLAYAEKVINVLKEFEDDLKENLISIKQDTIKYTIEFLSFENQEEDLSKIGYLLKRRLANYLEQINQTQYEPFEMYIYPPVNGSLLVADIIKEKSNNKYFIILTPSCDMAERANTTNKIHLASIESSEIIFKVTSLIGSNNREKVTTEIKKRIFNQGYLNGVVPLPELPNHFDKTMAINLRNCVYIDRNEIDLDYNVDDNSKKFTRVASLNSPYRELVVWAFMSLSCRPGLPERNLSPWANSLFDERQ